MSNSGQDIRVEEQLSPVPSLGSQAFRRTVTIRSLPENRGVSLRLFSKLMSNETIELPTPSSPDWLRVSQGRFDWLVQLNGDFARTHWSIDADSKNDRAASKNVSVSVLRNTDSVHVVLDQLYIRVPRGANPPLNLEKRLHSRGGTP